MLLDCILNWPMTTICRKGSQVTWSAFWTSIFVSLSNKSKRKKKLWIVSVCLFQFPISHRHTSSFYFGIFFSVIFRLVSFVLRNGGCVYCAVGFGSLVYLMQRFSNWKKKQKKKYRKLLHWNLRKKNWLFTELRTKKKKENIEMQ